MNNEHLIQCARRAKGSELLPRVMLNDLRADDLLLRMADELERLTLFEKIMIGEKTDLVSTTGVLDDFEGLIKHLQKKKNRSRHLNE